jgi:hypothetical protein
MQVVVFVTIASKPDRPFRGFLHFLGQPILDQVFDQKFKERKEAK